MVAIVIQMDNACFIYEKNDKKIQKNKSLYQLVVRFLLMTVLADLLMADTHYYYTLVSLVQGVKTHHFLEFSCFLGLCFFICEDLAIITSIEQDSNCSKDSNKWDNVRGF